MEKLKIKGEPPTSLPTQGSDSWRSPFKEDVLTKPRTQAHPLRLPPQQHLASLAGRGLLEGEHLEVMPVGCGILRVDVGARKGGQFQTME